MSISPAKLADSLTQLQQLFTRADKNTDGTLSKTEFADAAKGIAGLSGASDSETGNLFTQMDTNGDGKLTTTELKSGIDLADKVQKALLMAQELTSGKTLLSMLSGSSSSDDSSNSMFADNSGSSSVPGNMNLADILGKSNADTTSDTTSTDPYTAMLQQFISKYTDTTNAMEDAAATPATGTVNQTV